MEPSCTPHMDANIGPIWVPYKLLAGILVRVPTVERKTTIKIHGHAFISIYDQHS